MNQASVAAGVSTTASRGRPRVSIGLPVYNGERYLAFALDSLIAQTYTDFEIVISDNASTDRTQEICEQYVARDNRIRYVRQNVNRGGVWNYNEVVRLACGDYFRWHAHDDACEPTLLAASVAVLDAQPNVVLCLSHSMIIDAQGEQVMLLREDLNLSDASPAQRLARYHQHDRACPLCSVYFGLVRRALLVKTPLMQGFLNSEATIVAQLALYGEFRVIPEHLFFRRDHPQNTTRSMPSNAQRVAWYKASRRVYFWDTHPGWRQVIEQLRLVRRVPMPFVERLRALAVVGSYTLYRAYGVLHKLRRSSYQT